MNAVLVSCHPDDRWFVSYISVSLHRRAARWKQALRERMHREQLILEEPLNGTEGTPEVILLSYHNDSAEEEYLASSPLEDVLLDPRLAYAYRRLTFRERQALTELVVLGESQTELAIRLRVTQQAVNRNKERALRRLRASIGIREARFVG